MKLAMYKMLIRYLAIKWTCRVNLGNVVWYKNELWEVRGGSRFCDSWNLAKVRDGAIEENAPRKECKLQLTIKNLRHSYVSAVMFYNTSWLDIWAREGIKDWMRECDIW